MSVFKGVQFVHCYMMAQQIDKTAVAAQFLPSNATGKKLFMNVQKNRVGHL